MGIGTKTLKISCKCCKESILRRMVLVTNLYLRLFGERIWANALLLRFGTVEPEDWVNSIGVSVSASLWVGRGYYQVDHEHQDVLLLKQDSFVTDHESSCRQSSRVEPQSLLAAAFMYHTVEPVLATTWKLRTHNFSPFNSRIQMYGMCSWKCDHLRNANCGHRRSAQSVDSTCKKRPHASNCSKKHFFWLP